MLVGDLGLVVRLDVRDSICTRPFDFACRCSVGSVLIGFI